MGMNGSNYEYIQLYPFGKPRWSHDCNKCKFVGTFGEEDVYLCGFHPGPTLLRRYGNEGSEYSSGDINYHVPSRTWDVVTENLLTEMARHEIIKFKIEVDVERLNFNAGLTRSRNEKERSK